MTPEQAFDIYSALLKNGWVARWHLNGPLWFCVEWVNGTSVMRATLATTKRTALIASLRLMESHSK